MNLYTMNECVSEIKKCVSEIKKCVSGINKCGINQCVSPISTHLGIALVGLVQLASHSTHLQKFMLLELRGELNSIEVCECRDLQDAPSHVRKAACVHAYVIHTPLLLNTKKS
jgi:hypothetical protein